MLWASARALADPATFDLTGPTVEAEVTRGAVTLPISQVPNLAAGDRVWLKAELSAGQSVHYLMIAVFLRGSTEPPAASWFSRCDTWTRKCSTEGIRLTVPKEARQLLVFLAPETGGDFGTLEDAVRGRPGVFVRASQDLNQAAAEHMRLQTYLREIGRLGDSDPARLKEVAPLLSRSLAIKLDEKCLEKPSTLQAACLMQGRESLIMADGHSESVTATLTSGPASDLAMQASNAPQLKSGYYGPFIGSILDIARLFDSFHTAKYQYIPALAVPHGRELALTLNAPPSFHDPKSVLVAALPPVENPQLPELRAVDSKEVYCLRKEPLVLAAQGAPLMFASSYAHHVTLRVDGPGGTSIELPATPDAARGGFVIDTSALNQVALGESTRGSLRGRWGFTTYSGPTFNFVDARAQAWKLAPGDEAALVVGRQDTVHLVSASVRCVSDIKLADSDGRQLKVDWKAAKADEVEAKLPLEDASAGEVTLLIRQYGSPQPQRLTVRTYAEAGHLDAFTVHAGDDHGVLRGSRLDEVATLALNGVDFTPKTLTSTEGHDELTLLAGGTPATAALKAGETAKAHVTLKDGRAYDLKVAVQAVRPRAVLIGKTLQPGPSAASIRLSDHEELPQNAQLTFSLHAQTPPTFTRDERIEVATADGSASTLLDLASGSMTLQDAKIAVARLDPSKAFGPSTFGPLRFRMVSHGVAGDWQPLATLVRLPVLKELSCPDGPDAPCRLAGQNLFLLDSVSADARFGARTAVPDGFTGSTLSVPRPTHGELYVKLRDDPGVISVAVLELPGATPGTASPTNGLAPSPDKPVIPEPKAPVAPITAPGPSAQPN
ncbi:MAG TPA: hypothetical protein VIE42_10515 [Steroidobacteraceae bacterium]